MYLILTIISIYCSRSLEIITFYLQKTVKIKCWLIWWHLLIIWNHLFVKFDFKMKKYYYRHKKNCSSCLRNYWIAEKSNKYIFIRHFFVQTSIIKDTQKNQFYSICILVYSSVFNKTLKRIKFSLFLVQNVNI